jgi:hypothetical protein
MPIGPIPPSSWSTQSFGDSPAAKQARKDIADIESLLEQGDLAKNWPKIIADVSDLNKLVPSLSNPDARVAVRHIVEFFKQIDPSLDPNAPAPNLDPNVIRMLEGELATAYSKLL